MTPDEITLDGLTELQESLQNTAVSVRIVYLKALDGAITVDEAASEINAIIETLKASLP